MPKFIRVLVATLAGISTIVFLAVIIGLILREVQVVIPSIVGIIVMLVVDNFLKTHYAKDKSEQPSQPEQVISQIELNQEKVKVERQNKIFETIVYIGTTILFAIIFLIAVNILGNLLAPDKVLAKRMTYFGSILLFLLGLGVIVYGLVKREHFRFLPFILGAFIVGGFGFFRYQPGNETVQIFNHVFGYYRIKEDLYHPHDVNEIRFQLYKKNRTDTDYLLLFDSRGRSRWIGLGPPIDILGTGFYEIRISSDSMSEIVQCTGKGVTWGDKIDPDFNYSEPLRCPFVSKFPIVSGSAIHLYIKYVVPEAINNAQFENVVKEVELEINFD